jgi:hypothetical protein
VRAYCADSFLAKHVLFQQRLGALEWGLCSAEVRLDPMEAMEPILLEPEMCPDRNDEGREQHGIRHAKQPAEHADATAYGARDRKDRDHLADRQFRVEHQMVQMLPIAGERARPGGHAPEVQAAGVDDRYRADPQRRDRGIARGPRPSACPGSRRWTAGSRLYSSALARAWRATRVIALSRLASRRKASDDPIRQFG